MVTSDVGTTQWTIKCEGGGGEGTIECNKSTITCDIGTTQYEDGTVKCEKKVNEPPNVRKELSHMMLVLHNVRIKSSNMRKK